jgi:hypothetical protein
LNKVLLYKVSRGWLHRPVCNLKKRNVFTLFTAKTRSIHRPIHNRGGYVPEVCKTKALWEIGMPLQPLSQQMWITETNCHDPKVKFHNISTISEL